jgi:hypothetical protein
MSAFLSSPRGSEVGVVVVAAGGSSVSCAALVVEAGGGVAGGAGEVAVAVASRGPGFGWVGFGALGGQAEATAGRRQWFEWWVFAGWVDGMSGALGLVHTKWP